MRNFILGTDWWTDCDDAAALRILLRAQKKSEINILCVGINACMDYSAASLASFVSLEGAGNIPIGIDREATDFGGNPPYQKRLAGRYNGSLTNDSAPDAAELYYDTLTNTKEKVEIIEIGYPQVLLNAIKKDPELFKEKVEKIWMMAGKWDDNPGRENNFARNRRASAAAAELLKICTVPIIFLGFEAAEKIITGDKLLNGDFLKDVYIDHNSENGRSSWDPMLAFAALTGNIEKAGFELIKGDITVNPESGENYFKKNGNALHGYLLKTKPDEYYKDTINELIKTEG